MSIYETALGMTSEWISADDWFLTLSQDYPLTLFV